MDNSPQLDPAYAAVYEVIEQWGNTMPPDSVHRNAMIWTAVSAALTAERAKRAEGDLRERIAEAVREADLRDRIAEAVREAAVHRPRPADFKGRRTARDIADVVLDVVGPEIAERDAALARVRTLADEWTDITVEQVTPDRERWLKVAGDNIKYVLDGPGPSGEHDD